jgi:hypothetical protein
MMLIGIIPFTDGVRLPLYHLKYGHQFVLDDDGEPVYGVWLHPEGYQEPVVIAVSE